MLEVSGKMDQSNTYNGFKGNVSFFINKNFIRQNIFEFFQILSIEEISLSLSISSIVKM